MSISRRDFFRAGAAVVVTAACSSPRTDTSDPTSPSTPSSGPERGTTSAPPSSPAPAATTTDAAAGPATEVRNGSRTSPLVALTFHGNGAPRLADRLLALLEKRGVHGSVLAVGTWLAANPTMAERVTAAGHDLGNHTQHHVPMRTLGPVTALSEINECAAELRARTGSIGTWFRASGTQRTNLTIRRAAARAGYSHCVSYDVDGLDWQDPSSATVVQAVLTGARNGSIVSLHLGHPVTLSALPAILDGLDSRHLRPVTLTELLT